MFGRLNVAILGTGNIAATMAETIRSVKGVRPYAVASRDHDRALEFGRAHGFKKAYGSYKELAEDKKVDLVYIATPHSEHFENARLCIEHGRNVLCEKPMTVNRRQAEELFRLADEKNVMITEALWTRYMPFAAELRVLLGSHPIGDIVSVSANLGYNLSDVNRLTDPELAGGALLDLGIYPLSFVTLVLGYDVTDIQCATAYTDRHLDAFDNITLHYRSGQTAAILCTMLGPTDRRGVITGTKGYIVVENVNNYESATIYDLAGRCIRTRKRPKQKNGYEYELQSCVHAIKLHFPQCPEMPHEETLRLLDLMDRIRRVNGVRYPMEKALECYSESDSYAVKAPDAGRTETAGKETPGEPAFAADTSEAIKQTEAAGTENSADNAGNKKSEDTASADAVSAEKFAAETADGTEENIISPASESDTATAEKPGENDNTDSAASDKAQAHESAADLPVEPEESIAVEPIATETGEEEKVKSGDSVSGSDRNSEITSGTSREDETVNS